MPATKIYWRDQTAIYTAVYFDDAAVQHAPSYSFFPRLLGASFWAVKGSLLLQQHSSLPKCTRVSRAALQLVAGAPLAVDSLFITILVLL